MKLLPYFQTDSKDMSLMQTQWGSVLNPVVQNPLVNGTLLRNVALINGTTIVNHTLGRKLQGWIPVRWHGAWGQVYDNQDSNSMPQLTLSLTSNAAVTVDLYVF